MTLSDYALVARLAAFNVALWGTLTLALLLAL